MMPLSKTRLAVVIALSGVAIFFAAANYFRRRRKHTTCKTREKPLKEVIPQRNLPYYADPNALRPSHRVPNPRSTPTARRVHVPGSARRRLSGSSGQGSPLSERSLSSHENLTAQQLLELGMDSLGEAVQHWQEAIHRTPAANHTEIDNASQRSNAELSFRLERLLRSAYGVQSECERTLSLQSLASSSETVTITLSGSERTLTGDFSDDDNDSFVSASELAELDDVTELRMPESRALYIEAMNAVADDAVHCRKYRTNLLYCKNDIDFLAKLHCVRQAFDVLFSQEAKVEWFIELGKNTMGDLIYAITQDADDYCNAYFNLIDYVREDDNWDVINQELTSRRVQCMNFYDVVLDFTLMDAFDDMDKLPASVSAIARNRWLSDSVKQTAMSNAIWSLIALKRKMLSNSDGFLSKFYCLSASMSPALCWGFLGPNEDLRNICFYFKDQVIKVLRNIFDLSICRYSSKEDLAEDILATIRDNAMLVEGELGKAMQK